MIEELLPAGVEVEEAFGDLPDAVLYEAERALVATSVESRRGEFATARHCARTALAALGVPPAPILRGERGAPRWPSGTTGSLTHCAGYRAAAVARTDHLLSLGIDAEPHLPLPSAGTRDLVALPEERRALDRLAASRPEVCWDRLLFSAKESVYKTWFPLTGRWLDFEEALITLDPDDGTFHARLLVPPPTVAGVRLTVFTGRWSLSRDLLCTAVVVPSP
ncbi:4'-phosphopantetheinyl transferase [Streptomyces sp. NPDC053493]|uniref:4'-phosphopantetheinyl transferase n=1 Tax=Streptomyces sp. NPDC053493 TaxID=3365705 RepID=UPI0037D64E9D